MIDTVKKKKIKNNILVFSSYFLYQIIVLIILSILNIDTNKLNMIEKNLYLIIPNLIYLIIIILFFKNELKSDISMIKGNLSRTIIKYIPYYIVGVLIMALSNIIIYGITGNALSENEINIREYIKLFPLYMSFSTVIYAPIVEELIFRKSIKNILGNSLIFVVASGVIFGLVHITSGTLNDFLTIIPYILMGVTLSYIYYKGNNIFTTITLHLVHNFLLLILQFIGG